MALDPGIYSSGKAKLIKSFLEALPLENWGSPLPSSTLSIVSWYLMFLWDFFSLVLSLESWYFIYPALLCIFHDCPCVLGWQRRNRRKYTYLHICIPQVVKEVLSCHQSFRLLHTSIFTTVIATTSYMPGNGEKRKRSRY